MTDSMAPVGGRRAEEDTAAGGPSGSGSGPPFAAGRRIRLGSGTAWALTTQAVTMASTLVISAIVARTLGPDGKGILSLLQQSVGVLVALGDLGIGIAAIYYISTGRLRPGTVIGNALVLLAGVTAAGAAGLVLLLRSPAAVFAASWTHVTVALVLLVASLLLSWAGSVATGIEGTRGAARAAITASLVTLALVVAAWLAGYGDPLAVLASAAVGSLVGVLACMRPVASAVRPVRVSWGSLRTMMRYAIRLHAATSADLIHFRQDILLLGWLSDARSVGLYSVALSLAEMASRLPSAVGAAIQAQASRVTEESALDFSARAMRLTVMIAAAAVIVLGLTSPVIVPLVFGASFSPAVAAFLVMTPRVLANSLVWPVTAYQSARGIVYWRVSIAAAALNAVLNVALVPSLGFLGAAAAASVSHTVLLALLVVRLRRDTGRPVSFFLAPTAQDLQALLAAVRTYVPRRH